MANPDFTIKTGDTQSSIFATLENSGGTPVDIQGATVLFRMSSISGGAVIVSGTATNAQVGAGTLDGSRGDVSYAWAGPIGTADLYLAEWQVAYATGGTQTFPNDGYSYVLVTGELG